VFALGAFLLGGLTAVVLGLSVLSEGDRVFTVSSQTELTESRVITEPDFILQSLSAESRGGLTLVEWHDSAFGSTAERTGSYITLYVDGTAQASSLRGGFRGEFEEAPAGLRWAGKLAPGRHRFDIRLDRVDAGFAVPYVAEGSIGIDNMTVTEYPAADS
jgi:hypothetical protein